jgi:delta-aminolevulinic acid dehydratase/porphobilinogen synthase
LLQRCVRALKKELPELLVITDVALDPYSSDGHDGYVRLPHDTTRHTTNDTRARATRHSRVARR